MAALEDVDAPSWRVEVLNVVTKGGKIVRKVAERYLRDDLSCSLSLCTLCSAEADAITAVKGTKRIKTVLAESPHNGVYLLPSMKTALLRMDILEFSTKQKEEKDEGSAQRQEVFADVLVLETVWEYVRRQDLRVYDRLKALIMDRRKKVTIPRGYENDDEVETRRESEEERNERAVATAWKWYAEHLKELQRDDVKILFLANDAEDLKHAEKHGVSGGVTIAEFLTPVIAEFPELQELLSMSTAEGEDLKLEGVSSSAGRGGKQQLYSHHLKAKEIMAGIKKKKYFKGTLRCEHWLVCHVLIHGANGVKIPVVVEGWEHINRAVDGDLVAIQMLPKDQWKRMSESGAGFDAVSASEEAGDETERQLEHIGEFEHLDLAKQNVKPTGRVVGVIQRNWRKCCGTLEPYQRSWTLNASGRCLVVPVDRKMPKIKIQTRQQEALMGKRLLVEIDSWPVDSKYPLGHYMRTLGDTGDELTETDVLLIEHDIASNQFSDEVMRCLPPEDWRITPQNSAGRRDLRRLPVLSIDPPNCCNIDDALHAKYLLTGNYEVGVHIADVTHFVCPGSALDKEAAARGISSYMVNRRCDMLPDLLTASFTSLTANKEHFAFSVLLELKLAADDVQVVGVDFCKSIIRSWVSLSYSEAQCLIDHSNAGSVLNHIESKPQRCARLQRQTLGNSVKMLSKIAGKLRRKRRKAGGSFDSDTEMRSFQDAKVLVEEFMLLADISVAKKIGQHFPLCSILRRHPIPSTTEVGSLVSEARAVGFRLRVGRID